LGGAITEELRRLSGSFALCESEATATNVFCAKAKRQQQMFYLCESEATATTNVLSVRKRSVSNKAPSWNGNQPHVMVMIHNKIH